MKLSLKGYEHIVGTSVLKQLHQLAGTLSGSRVVHVNSTRSGGGVAEILHWMVPLMKELGMQASWEVIGGKDAFFKVTKGMHNGLQGEPVEIREEDARTYMETSEENARELRRKLEEADFVFIHDPQPAPLLNLCSGRKGSWVWRCHIDLSRPHRPVWKFLKPFLDGYDASIFSMAEFSQVLSHPQFIVRPSINPLNETNCDLDPKEVDSIAAKYGIDRGRPLLVQVSRFDRFKDPVGVIKVFHMVSQVTPVQLVLAGGGATDDPEGEAVYEEAKHAAGGHPDIHVLQLPGDAHRTINALQRAANIILQKSTREGFGLTVAEGLWKGKPVIGGDTGGIRVQVHNYQTGFLVNTPEGAAHRIRYLLRNPGLMRQIGEKGKEFVRENFLLTRHLREYLTLMNGLRKGLDKELLV
jgi:trehalose synthase